MAEVLAAVLMLACAVAITPFLWEVCDRGAARRRLGPQLSVEPPHAPPVRTDLVTFLAAVARSVRAGSSPAQAVLSPPPASAALENLQQKLAGGSTLAVATTGEHPHLALLRACMHGESLSAAALDRAVESERSRVQAEHDISVAIAQAARSARVLTVLPFAFLLLATATSRSVRSHLFSPLPVLAVGAGVALNLAGRRWMRRLVLAAARPSPVLRLASDIASTVALHLFAGGTVTDAFVALSSHDPSCADVAARLQSGHTLAESLQPIGTVAPQVVRTLLDAHRDGLPLIATMTRLADDLHAASTAHIKGRVAQVGVRSTTPLVLCTLPSFLLVGLAPMVLAALSGLSMHSP